MVRPAMPAHDVLIIGAGLAGQRAALAAADAGATVAIMSKVHPVRSHSVAAAGGINAALNPEDDVASRTRTTRSRGRTSWATRTRSRSCAARRPTRSCTSSTSASRSTATRRASSDRAPSAAPRRPHDYVADITGQAILHVLYEQLMKYSDRVDRYEEWFTTSLVLDDDGRLHRRASRATSAPA